MDNFRKIKWVAIYIVRRVFEFILLPLLVGAAVIARYWPKNVEVGLGPEPLINNIYHKKALIKYGYKAETFVDQVYFITKEFDWIIRSNQRHINLILRMLCVVYFFAIFRYKSIYIYFNGGPLFATLWLWRFEPYLYKLAKIKVVIMPYGGDVQDLTRCPNLMFRHVMSINYPMHRLRRKEIEKKIDIWTKNASHVIGGCDWVDYLYYWDTLMLAHFSIDVDKWSPTESEVNITRPLRVLHAPNHRALKGTDYIIKAIEELKSEGVAIELVLLEKVPNDKVREVMASVDIVADQLIIGWYAMFALEAMSMGKPVICYLREDLERLYINSGLINDSEIPIINSSISTIKRTLKDIATHKDKLIDIQRRSREFVIKHHSVEAVGKVFDRINNSINISPSQIN